MLLKSISILVWGLNNIIVIFSMNFLLLFVYRNFDFFIFDVLELVYIFLEQEQDVFCKRNVFMMFIYVDQVIWYLIIVLSLFGYFLGIIQIIFVKVKLFKWDEKEIIGFIKLKDLCGDIVVRFCR